MFHSDPPMPHQSFSPHSVIFPQVENNSYLPRGVMNGRPLLKCLSITFECSFSLTSEQHTHWAKLHKQAHTDTHAHTRGSIFAQWFTSRVLFSWGAVGFFLTLSVLAILCAWQWEERSSGDILTSNPAAPCRFFVTLVAKQRFLPYYTNPLYSVTLQSRKKGEKLYHYCFRCLCRSQTHDCNTQANKRLFLAVGFLVYVIIHLQPFKRLKVNYSSKLKCFVIQELGALKTLYRYVEECNLNTTSP